MQLYKYEKIIKGEITLSYLMEMLEIFLAFNATSSLFQDALLAAGRMRFDRICELIQDCVVLYTSIHTDVRPRRKHSPVARCASSTTLDFSFVGQGRGTGGKERELGGENGLYRAASARARSNANAVVLDVFTPRGGLPPPIRRR